MAARRQLSDLQRSAAMHVLVAYDSRRGVGVELLAPIAV